MAEASGKLRGSRSALSYGAFDRLVVHILQKIRMGSLKAGEGCIQTRQCRSHPLKLGLKLPKTAIQCSQSCTDFLVACQQRCIGIGQLLGAGRRLGQPRFDLTGSRRAAFDAALDA
ncbi:hypothetical protein D3C75_939470 [compost metagenome]